MGEQCWQLEKGRFRSSLAGCTVTIHQHLEGAVSIRYGPHVVGRFPAQPESGGKGGPLEIPRQDFHFPTAPATIPLSLSLSSTKTRKPPSASRRGVRGAAG